MRLRPSILLVPVLLMSVAAVALLGACTPAPRDAGRGAAASPPSRNVQPDTNPMEAGRPPVEGGQRAVTPILTR